MYIQNFSENRKIYPKTICHKNDTVVLWFIDTTHITQLFPLNCYYICDFTQQNVFYLIFYGTWQCYNWQKSFRHEGFEKTWSIKREYFIRLTFTLIILACRFDDRGWRIYHFALANINTIWFETYYLMLIV